MKSIRMVGSDKVIRMDDRDAAHWTNAVARHGEKAEEVATLPQVGDSISADGRLIKITFINAEGNTMSLDTRDAAETSMLDIDDVGPEVRYGPDGSYQTVWNLDGLGLAPCTVCRQILTIDGVCVSCVEEL